MKRPLNVVVVPPVSSKALLIVIIFELVLERAPPAPMKVPLEGRAPCTVAINVPFVRVTPPEKVLLELVSERLALFVRLISRVPGVVRSTTCADKIEEVLDSRVSIPEKGSMPVVPPRADTIIPELASIPNVIPDRTLKESTVMGAPVLFANITKPDPKVEISPREIEEQPPPAQLMFVVRFEVDKALRTQSLLKLALDSKARVPP